MPRFAFARAHQVLGTDGLHKFLEEYDQELDPVLFSPSDFAGLSRKRKPLSAFVTKENRGLVSDAALDFLDRLLCYDMRTRMTAAEALSHPYLAGVGDASPHRH